ncbi:sensor histidine kinase [Paenibacillus castaneae]|nr:HAMP domain-containing sensor histidine kinase [Paenibacillus castaneae]
MTYVNTQNENYSKLQNLSSTVIPTRSPIHILARTSDDQNVQVMIPKDYTLSFNVILDGSNRLISVHSFVDMPEEVFENAARFATDSNNESARISLNGKLWLFIKQDIKGSLVFRDNGDPFGSTKRINNLTQISFLDITESQKILTQLLLTFGAIGIVMLFVIWGVSVFFAKRAVAPVEVSYDKQKQFIADASHELKTPIAVINANADALLTNKKDTVESQEKWIGYIKAETDRMSKLVSSLLYLAKTEHAETSTESLPFNLSDTVRDTVLLMEAVAYETGLILTQHIEPNIIINGESEKLAQVVKILFDNAIKYSDSNGGIEITLKKSRHQVVFSITNTSMGISKEHLSKIFDRFYRPDPSRTYDGSYGLGLPIAKAIIENMGGKIYAMSVEGQSTTFTFVLHK